LGFDIALGDFDLSVTWNNTEFENRIVDINGQDIMQLDFLNFQTATGFAGNGVTAANQPSEQQLRDWIANPASNKDIIRDPGDIFTILQVNNTSTINAETVEVEAIDIAANYRFSLNNWGDFRVGLQATFIDHFYYQGDASAPIVDGAGLYNDTTSAAPELPEWKANLTLGWTMGKHSVNTITRFVDEMPYDGPQFTHLDFFGGFTRPQGLDTVRQWTQMDASYTYRGIEMLGGEGSFTLGSRNLFDRKPQGSPEFAGVLGGLQDPMGRTIYARFIYDF
ncbi:MAG: hypothetical protein JKY29_13475, partial [Gammaproteobacteria bacterium]|nr:hypothetical protein [Gammaproteobacteria bacterium]